MAGELILVVEDEKDILSLISFNLEREGYRVLRAETGEAALRNVRTSRPDMVVLDLMLPGMDGIQVCKRLRSDPDLQDVPILMLTARSEDVDVIAGLDTGADDYMTKPFSPRILLARIRALSRRHRPSGQDGNPGTIEIHGIEIDLHRHTVTCAGRPVVLSVTEFAVLAFLARKPGWVYSRSQIITAVKGDDYPVTERSVDVQILGLRKKLGSHGDCIRTVRGVGYKMQEPG